MINNEAWLPAYNHQQKHQYILLTSLNLGGAEKIVSDQLWANYYSNFPQKVTLIVIYEKEKEHSLPPNVNVVRLCNNVANGALLFQQIAYEKANLVCHLINEEVANYIFSFGIHIHLVIHNDKRGWSHDEKLLSHPNIIGLVAVCKYVEHQLREYTNKPIFTVRHQIDYRRIPYNEEIRQSIRNNMKFTEDTIVIGMTGRICEQKNYFLALDVIAKLSRENSNYHLVILGGFEQFWAELYLRLLNKINILKIHKNVHLMGFRTNVHDWINTFDVALNTSYFEGLSMATQEFMVNGLPVVLSNVCGQSEIYDGKKQLHFFDIPDELMTPATHVHNFDDAPENYINLVDNIIDNIKSCAPRSKNLANDDEYYTHISRLSYASHRLWNMLPYVGRAYSKEKTNTLFVSSNLNLGGAQRSLINLMKQCTQTYGKSPTLALLNQSNQQHFFNELLENKIDYYLCHSSHDVFDIATNLLQYCIDNTITRIIFWNAESKIKLLLSKLLHHQIEFVDVSPGDYCFVEMDDEKAFQDGVYYYQDEYYGSLWRFVSKYDNQGVVHPYKSYLQHPTVIIPNGVYDEQKYHRERCNNHLNNSMFNIMVCGRIAPSKHLEIILAAYCQFMQHAKHAYTLHMIGSVEPYNVDYYYALKQQYPGIVWHGHVDNPQSIMKDYDGIIVLGTHQGSPNVVLEAAACKLPVIANDSGGTCEIIQDTTGILLPASVALEPLLQALQQWDNDYENALQKADNCYQLIQDKFSMDRMMADYEDIIF